MFLHDNTSNTNDMSYLFYLCDVVGDLSKWDILSMTLISVICFVIKFLTMIYLDGILVILLTNILFLKIIYRKDIYTVILTSY